MSQLALLLATLLLGNLLLPLWWVLRGPTAADRMLVALLFGTSGVAVLLLLAQALAAEPLVDVALVFAVLAAITGVAFAQRAWRGPPDRARRDNLSLKEEKRHDAD